MSTFQLGPYTVHLRQQPGQQCPLYHVFLGSVKIGKSISVPDLGCCQWLERQQRDQTGYAYSTERLTDKPYGFTAVHHYLHYKKKRPGRPRKADAQRQRHEALVGD